MNTVFQMKIGAVALLFAGFIAASGPATAKSTIECKNQLVGGASPIVSTQLEAQAIAINFWRAVVIYNHGQYWKDFSKAKNIQITCEELRTGWKCTVAASPCAQVKPPSPSAHHLNIPPQRWQRPQNKRSLQRYRLTPPARTQHLRSRFRSPASRSRSRLR